MPLTYLPDRVGQSAPNAYAKLKDIVYPDQTDGNYLSTLQELKANGNLNLSQGKIDGTIINIFRSIQWTIIRGLVYLSDLINTSVVSVLSFLNFADNDAFKSFIDQFMPLVIILSMIFMLIAIIGAMSKKELPIMDVLKNGAFSWFVYLVLPILMSYGTSATQNFVEGYSQSNASPAQIVVKNNLWDLRAMDKTGWNMTTVETMMKNGEGAPNFLTGTYLLDGSTTLTTKDFDLIDVNTKLLNKEEEKFSSYGQKIVSHGVLTPTSDAYVYTPTLYKLDDDLFGEDTHYYAYSWHFWTITLSLLAFLIVGIFTIWRLFQLETEIIMTWSIGSVVALTQWGTQKRNFEILQKLFFGFVTLLFTANLLQIYSYGLSFINTMKTTGDINILVYIIGLLAFSFAIIDGPKIWQDIFGIDSGMSSSTAKVLAAIQGGKMAAGLAKAIGRGIGKGVNALGGFGKSSGKENSSPEVKNPDRGMKDVTPEPPLLEINQPLLGGDQPLRLGGGVTPTDGGEDGDNPSGDAPSDTSLHTIPESKADRNAHNSPATKGHIRPKLRLTPEGNIESIPPEELDGTGNDNSNVPEIKKTPTIVSAHSGILSENNTSVQDSHGASPEIDKTPNTISGRGQKFDSQPNQKTSSNDIGREKENSLTFPDSQKSSSFHDVPQTLPFDGFGEEDWSYLINEIPPEPDMQS